jgi:predicted amidophosphoribosyltransferase
LLPVADDLIRRVKRTKDQTGLTATQRVENMKGAFSVARPEAVTDKRILLIDDVTTTGATLNEAALELRSAGCRKVFAAVIAVALPASSVVEGGMPTRNTR